jgi:hypothetical protein
MDLPSDEALRWIVRTYARLRAAHGEALGDPTLVQPTGKFFPDEFRLDAASVERLLRRIIGYSPVSDDIGIELAFVEPEADHAGGCGSLACGTAGGRGARGGVQELPDGYRVVLAATDVGNPDVLTTALARSVGALALLEAGEEADPAEAEIVGVACGFGVLLANGAAVWAKSCGGLRMARATVLSVEELSVALALFAAVHETRPSEARSSLGATQREAFASAEAWVESNPLLVETLRDRPALLEAGVFDIEPVRGIVGRWLHRRKVAEAMRAPASAGASKVPVSDERRRRLEEARALVDEVLGGE